MLSEAPIDDIVCTSNTTVQEVESHARLFVDTISTVQRAYPEWSMLVLGTSWINGYQTKGSLQTIPLRSLLTAVSALLRQRGLEFLFGDEAQLHSMTRDQQYTAVAERPRIVGAVGPGRAPVLECGFASIWEVSDFLTIDSYFPILPVLTIALRAAFDLEQHESRYRNVVFLRERVVPLIVPRIEPRDYEDLVRLYRASAFYLADAQGPPRTPHIECLRDLTSDVEEFGHVGITRAQHLSPADGEAAVKTLSKLFQDMGWDRTPAYLDSVVTNGWTVERISGANGLLRTHDWYRNQLHSRMTLSVLPVEGHTPGGVKYHEIDDRFVLRMDLSKPQFQFARLERYMNVFFMHEHTHERQGRLSRSLPAVQHDEALFEADRTTFLKDIGFRDWESDLSMPPFFFTQRSLQILKEGGVTTDVIRQARDIHADATSLRSGHRNVRVNEHEAALGLTPLGKTLLEYVFETLNYTPKSLSNAYGDDFRSSNNIPVLARFRAVCDGLAIKAGDLPEETQTSILYCLELAGKREEERDCSTVLDLEGTSIAERIRSLGVLFDTQAKSRLNERQSSAYTTLSRAYSEHLVFCVDLKTALKNIGVERLAQGLNDESDTNLRARCAQYLGETHDPKALRHLRNRLPEEGDAHVRECIVNSAIEVLSMTHPEVACQIADNAMESGGLMAQFSGLSDLRHLAIGEPLKALELVREHGGELFLQFQCRDPLLTISTTHPDQVIRQIIRPLLSEDYWEYRGLGLRLLGDLGKHHPDKAIPILLEGIQDENDPPLLSERAHAFKSIAGEHPEIVLREVMPLLSLDDGNVSNIAVEALVGAAEKNFGEVWETVEKLTKSKNKTERNSAIRAFGGLGAQNPVQATQKIDHLVETTDEETILAVAEAVASIGNHSRDFFEELLDKYLGNQDPVKAGVALVALGHYSKHAPFYCLHKFRELIDAIPKLGTQQKGSLFHEGLSQDQLASISQKLGFAVSIVRGNKFGVADALCRKMADHENAYVSLSAMCYAHATGRYIVNDARRILVRLKDEPTFGHIGRFFLRELRKEGEWDMLKDPVPKLSEEELASITYWHAEYTKTCNGTERQWKYYHGPERNLPRLTFYMRELGIEHEESELERHLERLEGKQSEIDGQLNLDFYSYAVRLGYALSYDAENAEEAKIPFSGGTSAHARRRAERLCFFYLCEQVGFPHTFSEEVSEFLTALEYSREARDGQTTLDLIFYLNELGVSVRFTEDDVENTRILVESCHDEEGRPEYDGIKLSGIHRKLARTRGILPDGKAGLYLTQRDRQLVYGSLTEMRERCRKGGFAWASIYGPECYLAEHCVCMDMLKMDYRYPRLQEDMQRVLSRADIEDKAENLSMHVYSAMLGVDTYAQHEVCERILASESWGRQGEALLAHHYLRSTLGLIDKSREDMPVIRRAFDNARRYGKGKRLLKMAFQLSELGERVSLDTMDKLSIQEEYNGRREWGVALAERQYMLKRLFQ